MMKYLYVTLGFLFLGLGAVGVFLPVLPTTPFLLLASFFFSKGSNRFHRWFCDTKLYKEHLEEFINSRSMTLRAKIGILILATSMMTVSFIVMQNWIGRGCILLLISFMYYYFIFRIKTVEKSETIASAEE
ncbi:YbaN family protein [Paenibacillus sp. D2_2]|uniref:YbaN family protein n=1 Tax=Paenibacillus sp. D2_2 TaxID=3073092 RepID=UPI0028163F06|nr:YbaN family protein [Paenibacillus sp. D2_2]WMT40226.1 YbaN family protein [Paenibacillus sp. D2_2]